jgi:hypothetical protein
MVSFLFWNLQGRSTVNRTNRTRAILESITSLTAAYGVDVQVFAECLMDLPDMLAALNAAGAGSYCLPPSRSVRVRIFTRLAPTAIEDVYNDGVHGRLTIRRLSRTGALPILLAGLHFHDRMRIPTPAGQALAATELARSIATVEDDVGYSRTVLVGDMNMNPFEAGMVGAQAFHGVMSRDLARTVTRLKDRAKYRCFYNPMWAFLGDFFGGPPGSYFYPPALDPTNHFWTLFDQVLVRPDIMDSLARVEILSSDGAHSLTSKRTGRPRKAQLSDHLPIYFELGL